MLPDTIKRIEKLIIKAEEATKISLKKYKHSGQIWNLVIPDNSIKVSVELNTDNGC